MLKMKTLSVLITFILLLTMFSGCIDEDQANDTIKEAEKEVGLSQDREAKYNSQHHYVNGTLVSVKLNKNWIGRTRNMEIKLIMNKSSKFSYSSYYDTEIINTFLFRDNGKYYKQLLTLVSQNISIYFHEKGVLMGGSNHNIKKVNNEG